MQNAEVPLGVFESPMPMGAHKKVIEILDAGFENRPARRACREAGSVIFLKGAFI